MREIIQVNRLYFYLVSCFLFIGLLLWMWLPQGSVILFFSDHRSSIGDLFFRYFTRMGEEWLYILAIVLLLFIRFRFVLLVPLMAFLVTVFSFLAKSFFAQDRPSVFFQKGAVIDQINLIEGVTLLQGPTSFPSGHTMSAFAMYGLLALILPQKKITAILLFTAALLVGISRMYLVQHFLRDVVTGAALGTMLALTVYYLQARIPYDPEHFIDRSLRDWRKQKNKVDVA